MNAVEYDKLTSEEREALVGAWYAEVVATPEPEAPPEPEPKEPEIETTITTVPMGWTFRLNRWLDGIIGLGSRDGIRDEHGRRLWLHRRLALWLVRLYPRFRRMIWIVRSGPAPVGTYGERMTICKACPYLKTRVSNGKAYCGVCGCPDWAGSELQYKNHRARNHCGQRRHPGEYIELATHTYPNRKKPGKKAGCGAGNHG